MAVGRQMQPLDLGPWESRAVPVGGHIDLRADSPVEDGQVRECALEAFGDPSRSCRHHYVSLY